MPDQTEEPRTTRFDPDQVTSLDQLREIYGQTSALVAAKKSTTIGPEARRAISMAPFFVLATASADGTSDASPRGGPPGILAVLDESTVAFPDLSGNRLLDSLTNIVERPGVGLLIVTPGQDETLRLNGKARLTRDPDLMSLWDGLLSGVRMVIVVDVDDQYAHCAKAFRRAGVWDPVSWNSHGGAPDAVDLLSEVLGEELPAAGLTAEDLRGRLEDGYAADLAEERP